MFSSSSKSLVFILKKPRPGAFLFNFFFQQGLHLFHQFLCHGSFMSFSSPEQPSHTLLGSLPSMDIDLKNHCKFGSKAESPLEIHSCISYVPCISIGVTSLSKLKGLYIKRQAFIPGQNGKVLYKNIRCLDILSIPQACFALATQPPIAVNSKWNCSREKQEAKAKAHRASYTLGFPFGKGWPKI